MAMTNGLALFTLITKLRSAPQNPALITTEIESRTLSDRSHLRRAPKSLEGCASLDDKLVYQSLVSNLGMPSTYVGVHLQECRHDFEGDDGTKARILSHMLSRCKEQGVDFVRRQIKVHLAYKGVHIKGLYLIGAQNVCGKSEARLKGSAGGR